MRALGLIETVGFTTAVSAADAAVKAADVEIIGMEKVIGVMGYVGVTIHLTGDVAAVTAAVEAGKSTGEMIGEIISAEVIPGAHSDVHEELISQFLLKKEEKLEEQPAVKKKKKTEKDPSQTQVEHIGTEAKEKETTVKKSKAASKSKKQSEKQPDEK